MKRVRKFSNKYYIRQIMACFLATCMFFGPSVYAGPEGASVVQGPVTFQQVGNTWNITQNTGSAIVNYSKFNVGSSEVINFLHNNPGFTDFAILNRILSSNPTSLNGTINSQGRVWFVNPAGVLFGGNARINVAQLVASGLNISDSDFINKNYKFESGCFSHSLKVKDRWGHWQWVEDTYNFGGNVTVNSGAQLNAAQIMLVGKSVFNDGTLTARDTDSTYVVMGAGDTVKFFQPGSDVIIEAANPASRKIVNNGNINTDGDVLLGAGDIYTKAIDNLDTLTAKSLGNITVDGAIDATGDVMFYADYDHQNGGDFLSTAAAPITSELGNIEIRGNDVEMGAAVNAGENLTIVGRDCQPAEGADWGNVHAKSTLTAGGDISISDTGEKADWVPGYWEYVGGSSEGNPGGGNGNGNWNEGNQGNGYGNNSSGNQGNGNGAGMAGCGDWEWVPGHWEYNYYPGTITLDGDVTAGANLKLYNDTYTTNVTGNGVTLKAGNNLELLNSADPYEKCTILSGEHYLALVAGNEVVVGLDTTIGVTGSTLLLHQYQPIDIGNYSFFNQSGTNLSLISDNGAVLAETSDGVNAADQWASIGAKAFGDITLSGNGSITLGDNGAGESASLHSTNGNISVTSGENIFAQKNIIADTGDITVKAANRLQLNAGASAGKNISLLADSDYRLGDNLVVAGPLYAGDTMNLEGANVYLHSAAESVGDMSIYAHGLYNDTLKPEDYVENPADLLGGGDVYNTLKSDNGNIDIKAQEFDYVNGPADYPDYHQYEFNGKDYDQTGDIHLLYGDGNPATSEVYAGQDVLLHNDTEAAAGLKIEAGDDIYVGGDDAAFAASDDPKNAYAYESIFDLDGDLFLKAGSNGTSGGNITIGGGISTTGDLTMIAGGGTDVSGTTGWNESNIKVVGPVITFGNLYAKAGNNIRLDGLGQHGQTLMGAYAAGNMQLQAYGRIDVLNNADLVTVFGDMSIAAGDNDAIIGPQPFAKSVLATGNVNSGGKLSVTAQDNIDLQGNVSSVSDMLVQAGKNITLNAIAPSTSAGGNMTLTAGNDVIAYSTLTAGGNIEISSSDDTTYLYDNVNAGGDLILNNNTMVMNAGKTLSAGDDVKAYGSLNGQYDLNINANDDVKLKGGVSSQGNMNIVADDDISLNSYWGATEAGGDMFLTAGDDVKANGNLFANGNMVIGASEETIYLGGDTYASGYIWLKENTKLTGSGDQYINAGGSIYADGFVRKVRPGDLYMFAGGTDEGGKSIDLRYKSDGLNDPALSTFKGNIWLVGSGDIQIRGDVTTFGPSKCGWLPTHEIGWETGGVAIVSTGGKIYTDDGSDSLNVSITGNSDSQLGLGVNNPFVRIFSLEVPESYAAIEIVSPVDLKIGANAKLNAYGRYYDDDTVNDRGFINFLGEPTTIPFGGPLRDPGQPFDLAIYLQSTGGNVDMSGSAQILSSEPTVLPGLVVKITEQPEFQFVPKGAMVIDAYDTVTFDGAAGGQFKNSLAVGQVGSRLEVCSRITEWLDEAVGRLPFPADLTLPENYNYVMRGAGAENPLIGPGAPAWVLESRLTPPPINAMRFLAPDVRVPEIAGCPAVIAAATAELGISPANIQFAMADTALSATDIQPCDTCARLVSAAAILKDEDGSRMRALVEAINAAAPANVPFTPEIGTQIAAAFENHKADGTAYASALEYVDAFVEYVKILDTEMNSPTGDPVAFAMAKHGKGITETDNANVAAFIASRLEQVTR